MILNDVERYRIIRSRRAGRKPELSVSLYMTAKEEMETVYKLITECLYGVYTLYLWIDFKIQDQFSLGKWNGSVKEQKQVDILQDNSWWDVCGDEQRGVIGVDRKGQMFLQPYKVIVQKKFKKTRTLWKSATCWITGISCSDILYCIHFRSPSIDSIFPFTPEFYEHVGIYL